MWHQYLDRIYLHTTQNIMSPYNPALTISPEREPIMRGELLRSGTHLDQVGSFTPVMWECDDEALRHGRVSSTSRPPWRRPGSWYQT